MRGDLIPAFNVIAGASLWGIIGLFTRPMYEAGLSPLQITFTRCVVTLIAIAVLKNYERDTVKLLKEPALSKQEKQDLQKMGKNANLVFEQGQRAVIVLAGRGIGPDTAARILRTLHSDEDEFLRDIMNAEILFAKNKRFWD